MKKRYYFLGFIALLIGYNIYNEYFTKSMLVGTYVNNYRIGMDILGELPSRIDTLRLYKNNRYKSSYWKNGSYELSYSYQGTYIKINPDNRYAGGFGTDIQRKRFKPAIMIYEESYYYRKID